jgi:hypothetical protein
MGSSFTEYRGTGFWSRDASIELWLHLLAQEVRQLDNPPEWLRAAGEEWHLQATVGLGGCVSAGLDKHAPTRERVALVLQLSERALAGLRERGSVLSSAWLNFAWAGRAGDILQSGLAYRGVHTRRGDVHPLAPRRGNLGRRHVASPVRR